MAIKKNEVKVLRALCKDARRTLEDIGNETGLTGPGVGKIIDRLEAAGVIRSYIALPALEKIGFTVVSLLLFRWDHSKGKVEELHSFLSKARGVVFATPIQGANFTHLVLTAHTDFAALEDFLQSFRTKHDGLIRDDAVLLMSPDRAIKGLNFDII